MDNALGPVLRRRREGLGLSMRQAAEALGITHGYLSQLETGKITLPNADVRRRLAGWIGVSHLDLLVLIGEIREDEITEAGKSGISPVRAESPAAELYALMDQINWYGRPDRVSYVKGLLSSMVDVDRQYREDV